MSNGAIDPEQIKAIVRQSLKAELDERRAIEQERHKQDHEWVKAQIELQKTRTEFYAEMRKTVANWTLVALLSFLAWKLFGLRFGVE